MMKARKNKGLKSLTYKIICLMTVITIVTFLIGCGEAEQDNGTENLLTPYEDDEDLLSSEQVNDEDLLLSEQAYEAENPLPPEDDFDGLYGIAVQVQNEDALVEIITTADETKIIELTQDIQLSATLLIPENKSIVLTSTNGNTFSLVAGGNFDVIRVENEARLVINGIHISRSPNTEGRGLNNFGRLILNSGLIADHLNNNEGALGWGGGVLNNFGASFIMRGGTITSNNAANSGGGVFNQGTFYFHGGDISENNASSGGGILNNGDFIMDGGMISHNTAQRGSGMYNGAMATFALKSGNIYRNISDGSGGGIFNRGTATMQGGVISGNISGGSENGSGGGILNNGVDAVFVIDSGEILNNTAYWGGGVANFGGTVIMNNGIISYNEAGFGGGIQNQWFPGDDNSIAYFNLNDGIISFNTANHNGGGINNTSNGDFSMQGGTISNNSANGNGGGVQNNGNFLMRSGTISNNSSESNDWSGGGGVANSGTYAIFIIDNGEIVRNRSYWGGGVFNNAGTFTMNNGTISHNEARRNGGGIQNQPDISYVVGYLNINGGTVSFNTANNNGGGINNASRGSVRGVATMQGGTVSNNNANIGGGINNTAVFTMHGGNITSNTGLLGGGGVRSSGEHYEFDHVRGDISNNTPNNID